MPMPLAIALARGGNLSYWPILPAALLLRAIVALTVVSSRVLRARLDWLLLPLEESWHSVFWVAGFFGKTIIWRGRRYRLHPDGRFEPARCCEDHREPRIHLQESACASTLSNCIGKLVAP